MCINQPALRRKEFICDEPSLALTSKKRNFQVENDPDALHTCDALEACLRSATGRGVCVNPTYATYLPGAWKGGVRCLKASLHLSVEMADLTL